MSACPAIAWRIEPVVPRFKVRYRLAERLVSEVARCLNGGISELEVPRPLEVGSRLVFELTADLVPVVELEARVLGASPLPRGWRLRVLYLLRERGGLDAAICRVLGSRETEPMRRSPRLPVHLPAIGDYGEAEYTVRDLSLHGGGVGFDGEHLPVGLRVGAPVKLHLALPGGAGLAPRGRVVWLRAPGEGRPGLESGYGIEFTEAPVGEALEAFERVLALKASPVGTRLSLGFRALAR